MWNEYGVCSNLAWSGEPPASQNHFNHWAISDSVSCKLYELLQLLNYTHLPIMSSFCVDLPLRLLNRLVTSSNKSRLYIILFLWVRHFPILHFQRPQLTALGLTCKRRAIDFHCRELHSRYCTVEQATACSTSS